MADHIDKAFVDIEPDVSGFSRKLDRDLDVSFERVERKLDDVVDSIEDGFDRLIKQLDIHFDSLTHSVDSAMDEIRDDARAAAERIGIDFEAGTLVAKHAVDDLADSADHDFRRIRRNARRSGEDTGRGFLGGLLDSIKNLGSNVSSSIGNAFGNVGSSVGSLFGGGGDILGAIKVGAIAAAIPVVIALAGALSQLIGLLALIPGLIGVAVAAIAPLIIAFQGMGDAISAGFSGDMEKFNEALKNLAPSARKVVKEIVGLKDIFSQLRKSVQEAFFAPLVGVFNEVGKFLLPVLNRGLTTVASALGKLSAEFLHLLTSNDILKDLGKLFDSTARIILRFTPSIIDFFGALIGVMEHSLPFVERFFDNIAGGLDKFTKFLSDAISGDKFGQWLENAFRVAGELWDLIKSLGNLLGSLFTSEVNASGEDFIKKLTEMINKLADFFRTAEGQKALHDLATTVKSIGTAILGLGVALANVIRWGVAFADWVEGAAHWVADLWPKIKNLWNTITDGASSAGNAIANFVSGAWSAVVNFFRDGWAAITGFFVNGWRTVVDTVTNFIADIKAKIAAFPQIMHDTAVAAFDRFFFAVGFGIGSIIAFFRDLPGKIWAILTDLWNGAVNIFTNGVNSLIAIAQSLPGRISTFFSQLWVQVQNLFFAGVFAVTNFFSSLPGRLSSIAESAKNFVVNKFFQLRDTVVNAVSSLVERAVATARGLPGRIADAISSVVGRAYEIGQNMIRGIINGIGSMVDSLVGAARRAVERAWDGAKRALGIGSPSKLWRTGGVDSMRGYEEGIKDRVPNIVDTAMDAVRMPVDMLGDRRGQGTGRSATSVNVGGAQIVAYLQIGDEQLHPVVVKTLYDNAQDVARAAEAGTTRLARRR